MNQDFAHRVDQPAWQRTGATIADATNAADALKRARLDWSVEQQSLFTSWPEAGFFAEVPNKVAIVRQDTGGVLGVVSPGYRPLQNHEVFSFLDALVAEERVCYESAGALRGGRVVWVLARLPRDIRVLGEDVLYPYVLLVNGHDGDRALRVVPTTVRVVCGNTLHLALRHASQHGLTIFHDQALPARMEQARRQLDRVTAGMDTFAEEVQGLARKQLSDSAVLAYFCGLAATRPERQQQLLLDALMENWHHPTNNLPGIEGSAWAAYNAVSLYADHQMPVRGVTEEARAEHRLCSVWFGIAHTLKQLAYDRALQLALAV